MDHEAALQHPALPLWQGQGSSVTPPVPKSRSQAPGDFSCPRGTRQTMNLLQTAVLRGQAQLLTHSGMAQLRLVEPLTRNNQRSGRTLCCVLRGSLASPGSTEQRGFGH